MLYGKICVIRIDGRYHHVDGIEFNSNEATVRHYRRGPLRPEVVAYWQARGLLQELTR